MAIFPTFFLGKICQENVFYDILERENGFLAYKNKKFKKSKNWHFSKRLNTWFWSKMAIFQISFFRQYRPGKCLLWYSKTKKCLSRLQKKKVQIVVKWTFFSKGLTHGFGPKIAIFSTFFFRQNIQVKCLLRYSRRKKRVSMQ